MSTSAVTEAAIASAASSSAMFVLADEPDYSMVKLGIKALIVFMIFLFCLGFYRGTTFWGVRYKDLEARIIGALQYLSAGLFFTGFAALMVIGIAFVIGG